MGLETAFQLEACLKALSLEVKTWEIVRNALLDAFMVIGCSHAPIPGVREEAKRFNTSLCPLSIHPRKVSFAARFKKRHPQASGSVHGHRLANPPPEGPTGL